MGKQTVLSFDLTGDPGFRKQSKTNCILEVYLLFSFSGMGGSSSKRRIVIPNSEDGSVTISEAVVRRMRGLPDEVTPVVDESPSRQRTSNRESPQSKELIPSKEIAPGSETDVSPPVEGIIPEPLVKPGRHRPYPDDINAEADDFYIKKLKELQERNAVLQKQKTDQFAKAVMEVENKFGNYKATPVCADLQTKVLECYQANPNEPLNCSPLVEAFSSCVDRARVAAISSPPPQSPPTIPNLLYCSGYCG